MDSREASLLSRARTGDTSAFEGLLAPLVEPAHRLATALLQDSSQAEDAVQEASVKAWRKLSRLRPGASMRPWYLGIVANECREIRRSPWWRSASNDDSATESPGPEDLALHRVHLRRTLMRLKRPERLVVLLHLYLDLPWPEVAAITGLTEAGARTRFYRALGRLRPAGGSEEVLI